MAGNFVGNTFGTWNVLGAHGADWYSCKCSLCGFEKDIRGYYLKRKPPQCSCQKNDILHKKFGELEVIEKLDNGIVKCKCSCGNVITVHRRYLQNGSKKSCGHDKTGSTSKLIDITGQDFGDWHVICYYKDKFWCCKCNKCGAERLIRGHLLRNGTAIPCKHTGREPAVIKKFGEWEVIDRVEGTTKWRCKCSCGAVKDIEAAALLSGASKSCGHATTGLIDLTGKTFGNWKVLGLADYRVGSITLWKCECQCENHTIRNISSYALRSGASKSCGCLTDSIRRESNLDKYGVRYPSQIGTSRTKEQLDMVKDRESIVAAINSFGYMPRTLELANLLGLDRTSTMGYIHRYSLEDIVDIGIKPVSHYEKDILDMFPGAIMSDRKVLSGKEIDLYYPDAKFGIEFNGDYWHSELKKDNNYHQQKSLAAINAGISLLHIFEYEWNNDKTRDKLIDLINHRLNSSAMRVEYARNCNVQFIDADTANKFLDDNHLQGKAAASVRLGLVSNNELLGLMTLGTPRFRSDAQYELIRLAFKKSTAVVGGAEKLFKHFIDMYDPNSIVSYCNIAKFSGNVYSRLGFKLDSITKPGYVWVNPQDGKVLSRYQTMKNRLVEAGLGTAEQSESDVMHELGYLRVYDCGNYVFSYIKKD